MKNMFSNKKLELLGSPWHRAMFRLFQTRRLNSVVRRIQSIEKKQGFKFDAFAVCGMSGVVAGTLLAQKMGKGLLIVRKGGEKLRSGEKPRPLGTGAVRGMLLNVPVRYLIVDDLISHGTTMRRIIKHIDGMPDAEASAILLYYESHSEEEFNGIPVYHSIGRW